MSYILDALKKSEQERGHGAVPGVQTIHSSSVNYHPHKRQWWPWLLVLAIVINIGALLYIMQGRNSVPETMVAKDSDNASPVQATGAPLPGNTNNKPQASITAKPAPLPAPASTPTATLATATTDIAPQATTVSPLAMTAHSNTQYDSAASVTPEPVNSTNSQDYVADLEELPLNLRQHIPDMTFSAHVYSSNALQRSLVINGRFMEEGDRVSNDLQLIEITRNGAVFDYQGQRFSTSVISGWN